VLTRGLDAKNGSRAIFLQIANCACIGTINDGTFLRLSGGILGGSSWILKQSSVDFDAIIHSAIFNGYDQAFRGVFLDATSTVQVFGACSSNGVNAVAGTVPLNLVSGTWFYAPATAVGTFTTTGGLQIDGRSNAYGNVTVATVVTVHQFALTPLALDTAAPTGFGGLAYVPGVAGYYGGAAIP
jgi:hypothetical protein